MILLLWRSNTSSLLRWSKFWIFWRLFFGSNNTFNNETYLFVYKNETKTSSHQSPWFGYRIDPGRAGWVARPSSRCTWYGCVGRSGSWASPRPPTTPYVSSPGSPNSSSRCSLSSHKVSYSIPIYPISMAAQRRLCYHYSPLVSMNHSWSSTGTYTMLWKQNLSSFSISRIS